MQHQILLGSIPLSSACLCFLARGQVLVGFGDETRRDGRVWEERSRSQPGKQMSRTKEVAVTSCDSDHPAAGHLAGDSSCVCVCGGICPLPGQQR